MPTAPEARDKYVRRLEKAVEDRRAELQRLREDRQVAELEDGAQTGMSDADVTILRDAGLIDVMDATEIGGKISEARAELEALQRLLQRARAVT